MDSDAEEFLGGVKSVGIPPSRLLLIRLFQQKQISWASSNPAPQRLVAT